MSRVTVLMAVYNGERYLRQAIESILNQAFRDFEFLIVNDGSTDGSRDIILSYNDNRIRLIDNEVNLGLVTSLNRGVELARGEYIARQDADDISLPERIAKQVDYLDKHPEVGLLGTWIEYINEQGGSVGEWRTPVTNGLIRWSLLFATCLAHPSVMMRRSAVERTGGYDGNALHAEDYDLWCRMSLRTKIANLPEFLVWRRIHSCSVSVNYSEQQEETDRQVMRREIQRMLGQDVSPEEIASLYQAVRGRPLSTTGQLLHAARLVRSLYLAYIEQTSLSSSEAKQVRRDAAQSLVNLASNNAYVFKKAAFSVLCQAIALDPGLLTSLRPVKVGLKLLGFRRMRC